ncbi:MAG: 3-deoxy-D-manno-octulosonic acid transferase [Bacteroidia bacterium]|nr:3-deoxy-D-manno-octulosonic acid transferase [Bacteroidia bacterium]
MRFLYSSGLYLYYAFIQLGAWFGSKKASLWITGRKNWREQLESQLKNRQGKVYWFHCSSLGEFEQGRPLIEAIKKEYPDCYILLSFFSPSGYEVRKNYPLADYICYLPIDSPSNASRFINLVKPTKVFFIKYDYWYYYLKALKENKIPVYVVSGIFRKSQHFFKWYGSFFRKMLRYVSHFFVQDQDSIELLKSIGIKSYTLSGDTRFDRVLENSKDTKKDLLLEEFSKDASVLICGSTWSADENIILRLSGSLPLLSFKIIIAPHEIDIEKINNLLKRIREKYNQNEVRLYSQSNTEEIKNAQILVLDTMGHLSSAYKYGDIAYVGGGFGKGIHNTLEPAAHGLPVIFGPKHEKFREASALIQSGAGFIVQSEIELKEIVERLLTEKALLEEAGQSASKYVQINAGATSIIMRSLWT